MNKKTKLNIFKLKNKRLQNLNCFLNVLDRFNIKDYNIIDRLYHNDICLLLEYNTKNKMPIAKILTKNGKIGYVLISNEKIQKFSEYQSS